MELRPHGSWQPPIVRTTATEGKGAAELLEAIAVHRKHLESTGGLQQIRRARLDARLLDLAAAGVVQALQDSAAFRHARAAVAEGRQSPRQAIRALTAKLEI